MGIPPGSRNVSSYNPINHTGTPAAADACAAAKQLSSNRFASATAAKSNLQGSACVPKSDAAGPDSKASSRPDSLLQLPARIDHLAGTACIHSSSSSGGKNEHNSNSMHTAAKAKLLTLRAAVDHLSGEGCTVRHVDVVATLDSQLPSVSRGMATRLVRDRQLARTAQQHNMSSCLYQPGQGYTKVLTAGQDKAAAQQSGSHPAH